MAHIEFINNQKDFKGNESKVHLIFETGDTIMDYLGAFKAFLCASGFSMETIKEFLGDDE